MALLNSLYAVRFGLSTINQMLDVIGKQTSQMLTQSVIKVLA
jgi:hypothetical protein